PTYASGNLLRCGNLTANTNTSFGFDLYGPDVGVFYNRLGVNGTVHLGGFYYILGKNWTGQTVSVRFLPASRSFRFDTTQGEEITTRPAQGLEKDHYAEKSQKPFAKLLD
ncbi:MAG: hypothetical protein MUC31_05450, partial [Bacteroidales bacterium]|nr:hypothetical protein [Bacteroidales bacterium]